MKINFFAIRENLLVSRTKVVNEKASNDMGILEHIEKIVEISKKHGIDKCLSKGKSNLDYVVEKLKINPLQAALFSLFMERSNDSNILLSQIASSIKCSNIRIIKYISECEELEKKKLIRCSRDRGKISFRVPSEVQDSIRKNNTYQIPKYENLSIEEFFNVLEKIFEERENKESTYEMMNMELMNLINLNMHLMFCKKLKSYNLYDSDCILLVYFCHLFGNNNDDNIYYHNIQPLYYGKVGFNNVKKLGA